MPMSVGRCVVAPLTPHERAVITAIHELGLEWHVIFNRESVMALPAGTELGKNPRRLLS
jgi:hypothetical protein